MTIMAAGLQVAFLALAFGLRTWLHARRTGSTGFRALGARRSAAEAIGAGGIALAAATSVLAVALDASGVLEPLAALQQAWFAWGGVVLAVGSLALVLAAQSQMGASWRIGVDQSERTALVTGGVFALSRNPIFLGMLLFWAGVAAMVPSALAIAAVVIAWAAIEVQVRGVEEPYLLRTHDGAYRRYASRTGRLLPGIGKLG